MHEIKLKSRKSFLFLFSFSQPIKQQTIYLSDILRLNTGYYYLIGALEKSEDRSIH